MKQTFGTPNKAFAVLMLFFCGFLSLQAQDKVGIGTTSPDASAALDVVSSNKGVLIPRTDTASISSPAIGLMVFQPADKMFYYYNGSRWTSIGAGVVDGDGDTKLLAIDNPIPSDSIRMLIDGGEKLVFKNSPGGDLLILTPTTRNNLFVGNKVGAANNNGLFNTAFGNDAFQKNVSGNFNTAVGYNSLFSNTGVFNVGVGEFTLGFNQSGSYNTALGSGAITSGNGGFYNVAVGYNAGLKLTGNNNVVIGNNALKENTTGQNNIAIGDSSGLANMSGSGNIFIGHRAGATVTGSNRLMIDNQAVDTTEALIYGDFHKDRLTANATTSIFSKTRSEPGIRSIKNYTTGTGSDIAAVHGENTVDDFYGYGVYGKGGYTGVYGIATQTGGGGYFGVRALSNGSSTGTNFGIYASAYNGQKNWAAYFAGNTYVHDSLAIGVQKPKQLIHNVGDYYGRGHFYLHALSGDGTSGTAYLQARDDSGTSSIDMRLRTQKAGAIIEAMSLDSDGNVGIGTTSPSASLHVTGSGWFGNDANALPTAAGRGVRIFHDTPSSTGNIFAYDYGAIENVDLILQQPGGNVGIGTSTAEQLLTIAQSSDPVVFRLERSGSGRYDYEIVNDAGSLVFRGGTNGTGNSLTEHMKIHSNGNIGIGTTADANSNLASGYKLSVNGKIASTEVRVQPTADWPDYVFAKDYDLLPLAELQKSIDQNNHLPGIPTADEVKENGIEVGEMQRKMMEKIEELTLYIIDLQEQINTLKNK